MATAMKRARLEKVQSSEEDEKEPNLKCHEMRLIFQRLPTSELARFTSNMPKHPFGKFWSQELQFVFEKRLPLSMKTTATPGLAVADHVIYDCNGSRVAEIKHPEYFHLSPICVLIQSAEVPAALAPIASSLPPQFMFPIPDILTTLTNLDNLVLWVLCVTPRKLRNSVFLSKALNPEVMSRIKSLSFDRDWYVQLEKPLLEIISRATSIKKLSVPYVSPSSLGLLATVPNALPGHYSGLESLSIKLLDVETAQPLLEIITTRFNGLHELFLPVRASIRQYLAVFQGLPSLATLGLDVHEFIGPEEAAKQLAVDENDLPIVSVTALVIACWSSKGKEPRALLAMLSKFPNVRTFGAEFRCHLGCLRCERHADSVLHFASAVCAGGVFRRLQSLKLFSNCSLPSGALLQFIRANIDHLPNSIDLSQVLTTKPRTLDREFFVDLCRVLQSGTVTSLALKDLVHRHAVPRLREQFALTKQDKSTPQANEGKIFAWIDEGLIDQRRKNSRATGWPEAVSDFTDFRIEACKTSGPLKGSSFKLRISDWIEKRERLFDV